jgi:integrase/recombinase XerD
MGETSSTSTELQPIAAATIIAPALSAGPTAAPPTVGADADPYWRLVTAFLVGYPPHSARAYFSDLKVWHAWCAQMGIHPLTARRHHVEVWVRHLSEEAQPATGRPASSTSIARRLSCLSQFYDYGIKDAKLFGALAGRQRPPPEGLR